MFCQPLLLLSAITTHRILKLLGRKTMPIHLFSCRLIPEPWQHKVSLCRKFYSTGVELATGFGYELYLDLVMNVSCHTWNTTKENLNFLVTGIFAHFPTLSLKLTELFISRQVAILCFQGLFLHKNSRTPFLAWKWGFFFHSLFNLWALTILSYFSF